MNPIRPLVVIGAGPAGIMAAISAAEREIEVLLLEKKNQIGGKIPVTGDGKGNLTNVNLKKSYYHSCSPEVVIPALKAFDFQSTCHFFEKLGLKLYIDEKGRVFPYSREALIIQKLLATELKRLKVEVISGIKIEEIRRMGNLFEIIMEHTPSFYARQVILATGGLAAPQLGATGDGYRWAEKLGHHLIPPFPSLVQLTTKVPNFYLLPKIKLAEVILTLFIDEKRLLEKRGDLLFIPHGVSGTAIFALSRAASEALQQGKKVAIQINLVPGLSTEELTTFLHEKKKNFPQQLLSLLLQGILPERLSQFILTSLHLDLNLTIGLLSEDKIDSLIQNLINFYLPITGTQSWKYAQVTGGGVTVHEVNPETMESKIVPHLYFAGEILDVDGDCGGYNLQWAWSSGYLAGKSAAENN